MTSDTLDPIQDSNQKPLQAQRQSPPVSIELSTFHSPSNSLSSSSASAARVHLGSPALSAPIYAFSRGASIKRESARLSVSPSSGNKDGCLGAGGKGTQTVRLQPFLHPEILDTSPCELHFACRLADCLPSHPTRHTSRAAAVDLPRHSSMTNAVLGGDSSNPKMAASLTFGEAMKNIAATPGVASASGAKESSGVGENGGDLDAPTNPKQRKADEPCARRARTPSLERSSGRPAPLGARPSFLVGESSRRHSGNNTEEGDEVTRRRSSVQYGIASIRLRSNARAIAVHGGDSRIVVLRASTKASRISAADSSKAGNMYGSKDADGGSIKSPTGGSGVAGGQWFELEYAPEKCVQECVFTVCTVNTNIKLHVQTVLLYPYMLVRS